MDYLRMDAEELKLERQRLRIETKLRRAELKQQREQFRSGQIARGGWRVIFTPTGAAIAAAIIGIGGTAASKWFDLVIESKKQETNVILKASEVPQNLDDERRAKQRALNLLWLAESGYVSLPKSFLSQLRKDAELEPGQIPSAPAVQPGVPPTDTGQSQGFYVCNETDENIKVSIAYYILLNNHWNTRGWVNLRDQKCSQIYDESLRNTRFYLYAVSRESDKKWVGNYNFCVDISDTFEIENANKTNVCNHVGSFFSVWVPGGDGEIPYSHTYWFTPNNNSLNHPRAER